MELGKTMRAIIRVFHHGNSGFTLTEFLVASALMLMLLGWISMVIIDYARSYTSSEFRNIVYDKKEEVIRALQDSCAWQNTLLSPENNTVLSCLKNGTSCSGQGGPILVRGTTNEVLIEASATAGLTPQGENCNSFDSVNGDRECPVKLAVNWTPICEDAACIAPSVRLSLELITPSNPAVHLVINSRSVDDEVLITTSVLPKNCVEVLASGLATSNIYEIDPDGFGGSCPVKTYCDMDRQGGGWTLAASAPYENYASVPVKNQLSKFELGRLDDSQMLALFREATVDLKNNVWIEFFKGGGGFDIALQQKSSTGFSSTKGTLQFDGINCSTFQDGPYPGNFFSSTNWSIETKDPTGDGIAGFHDGTGKGSTTDYDGFFCHTCIPTTSTCGISGCCDSGLRGHLWVR